MATLIHELLHIALPSELAAFGTFEEPILERVLEPDILAYVQSKPAKLRWWLARLPS